MPVREAPCSDFIGSKTVFASRIYMHCNQPTMCSIGRRSTNDGVCALRVFSTSLAIAKVTISHRCRTPRPAPHGR
jgi:hypothetical protein